MSLKTNKKLCWNCEGSASLQDESCPYCGVSLEINPIAGTAIPISPLSPPYSISLKGDEEIPAPPYGNTEAAIEKKELSNNLENTSSTDSFFSIAIMILTLLFGSILLLFGLVLALFSNSSGILTLSWEGSYWYLYLLFGSLSFYFGWRAFNRVS